METKIFGVALKWLLIAVAAIALVVWIVSCQIGGSSQEARQGQTNAAAADAQTEAAAEAVAVIVDQSDEEIGLQELSARAAKEIDNAKSPADARRAALDAACELQLYRDDPACQMRGTDPR